MNKKFTTSIEVEQFHHSLGLSSNFCIAPFTTLLLEPDGKVGACRHKGSEFPVANILHNTFEEIWNGPFIKNWRSEFLNGKPKICSTEVKDRKCHHCPEYNSLTSSAEITIKKSQKPLRIAFNFNGHCNLECTMCHIWQKPNGLYDQIGFWERLDEWITDLQEVELLSGEPFIQKDTYKLIDQISEKKPDCYWTITTNANWILSDYVVEKLNKVKIKNIIVSLDSVREETYKKIRKKGSLQKALNTLRELKIYEEKRVLDGLTPLNIKVNFLIQKENWRELQDVNEFSKNESVSSFKTFLYEPSQYSLLTFTQKEREEVLDYYFFQLSADELKTSMRVIRPLLDSLPPIDKFNYYQKLHYKFACVV